MATTDAAAREEKVAWMRDWATKHGVTLGIPAEAGIGHEVIGMTYNGVFVTYPLSDQGIWEPKDAYTKHPIVAVYVIEDAKTAEAQLYEWLRWFDENGFVIECGEIEGGKEAQEQMKKEWGFSLASMRYYARLVRNNPVS